jgi:hypothetical protein
MRPRDRVKLLFGPYTAPRLRKGDRATCLYRDCDVAVTGWTGARVSWPRCLPPVACSAGHWSSQCIFGK